MRKRAKSQLTGTAGEHYVAFRLSKMGYVVALPRGGSPAVDLLVSNTEGTKTAAIQVKTTHWAMRERGRGAARKPHHLEFALGHNAANNDGGRLVYVFVDLKGSDARAVPDAYVIPSSEVRRYCATLSPDTKMVRWHPGLEHARQFLEKWDLVTALLE